MKSSAKFDLLLENIQCVTAHSLKKLNTHKNEQQLLYLLNHISCFEKISRICCGNTHLHNLKVWPKCLLPFLKCGIFF